MEKGKPKPSRLCRFTRSSKEELIKISSFPLPTTHTPLLHSRRPHWGQREEPRRQLRRRRLPQWAPLVEMAPPRTFTRHAASLAGPADSTVLPLGVTGPPDEHGNQPHHYWPFTTSDLYNWCTQYAKFSDNPRDLINLLETVLFTHQPTWDDYQQLLQILFTTEEHERIQNEARKLVPGDNNQLTTNFNTINLSFPLSRPEWDFNTAEELNYLLLLTSAKKSRQRSYDVTENNQIPLKIICRSSYQEVKILINLDKRR
ncbi:uncharacterized protein LOC110348362 [Heterocephalus glaber]|uniref:Uncharacterized protein LOC110348362 n=1 Tax=Heterocephalus glaber TaxID=10181 RepID=A0AAX6ST86_HETGA|nr:uncharacterized protein LOC110348362 [Heterocephalus glaber]